MDFTNFKQLLITNLKNNNKNACIKLIKNNKSLIESQLDTNNSSNIKIFVETLNDAIIQNKNISLSLVKKILDKNIFCNVLYEFQNSNILIRACKLRRIKLIKWLIAMNINQSVQDKKGRTALMYIVQVGVLLPIVELFLKDKKALNMTDNHGRNALFYTISVPKMAKALKFANINVNQKDCEGNTALSYACKNGIYVSFKYLFNKSFEFEQKNNEGKSVALYLIEQGRFEEFKNYYFQNLNGKKYIEDNMKLIVTTLLKQIYQPELKRHPNYYIPYYNIFKFLIQKKMNFNITIDDEGNTPLMFFIMIEDFCTVYYMINHCSDLDFSIKNKHGMDAFSLCLKYNNPYLTKFLIKRKTMDFTYKDGMNNNLLIYFTLKDDISSIKRILLRNKNLLDQRNDKKETALIVATKLNRLTIVMYLLQNGADVNAKDYLGNTPIYYAVDIQSKSIIDLLTFYKADINIKNNRGKSALDLINLKKKNDSFYNIENSTTFIETIPVYIDKQSSPNTDNTDNTDSSTSSKDIKSLLKTKNPKKHFLQKIKKRQSLSDDTNTSYDNSSIFTVDIFDISHLNIQKYQNTIDFHFCEKKYPYHPLPYNDGIKINELYLYKLNHKGNHLYIIEGDFTGLYYRSVFFKVIALFFSSLLALT